MADTYRLLVSGHLDDRWSEWLGGLTVQRQGDGTTELVGPVIDQAALHGVIGRIRDLGVPLLSLYQVGERNGDYRWEAPAEDMEQPGGRLQAETHQ